MISKLARLAAYAVIVFLASPAAAQDAEAPLGVHPQGSQTHWYDRECCNLTDCARIHVRIKGDHYVWDSWRYPGFTVRVPVDRDLAASQGVSIKASQDGDFHGCERPRGIYTGDGDGGPWDFVWKLTDVEAICLYVPANG